MRSAGCIINDIWDKEYDAKVERTKSRPLASGALSVKQALALLFALLAASLLIVTQLKWEVFYYALASLPFIILYPLMKRITWWPQAFLGLTFNFGALMGWVAVTGEIALPAILLYISGIFWTLGYDTIYAFQDIEDDQKIGVKSTAILLQNKAKPSIRLFFAISYAIYLSALYSADVPLLSYIASIAASALLIRQIEQFDSTNPNLCLSQFKAHFFYGLFVLIPILVYYLDY